MPHSSERSERTFRVQSARQGSTDGFGASWGEEESKAKEDRTTDVSRAEESDQNLWEPSGPQQELNLCRRTESCTVKIVCVSVCVCVCVRALLTDRPIHLETMMSYPLEG